MPTNTGVFFAKFTTMQEKQILPRAIKIQKMKFGGNYAFFRDNQATIILKSFKI